MAFAFKFPITIDRTKCGGSDSTNFSVLVSGTYAGQNGGPDLRVSGSGGGVQNSSGFDVGFYSDSALTTKLPWETERWTSTTGEVDYWVQVPNLSHSKDTVFYLAYGDASVATDQSNATGTWNSGFRIVQHFRDGTSLSLSDSTTNFSAVNRNTATAGVGKVGPGMGLSGTAYDEITNGANSISSDDTHAVAIWVKSSSFGTQPVVWSLTNGTNDAGVEFLAGGTTCEWFFRPGSTGAFRIVNADISDGAWHRIVAEKTGAGDSGNFYLDGVLCTTASGSLQSNPSFTSSSFYVGSYGAAQVTWQGSLDELNVSNVVRGADWWLADYNNQAFPDKATFGSAGFYTIGQHATQPTPLRIVTQQAVLLFPQINSALFTRKPATTPGITSRTAADTAGGSDSATGNRRNTVDTAGGTDAAVRSALAFARTASDTAGATDTATRGLGKTRTATDTAGGTDAAVRVVALPRVAQNVYSLLLETGSYLLNENGTRLALDGQSPYNDSAGGTDVAGTNRRNTVDTAGGTDGAVRAALARSRTASDTAGATDSASSTRTISRTCSDTAGGTDAATRIRTSSRTAADTTGGTESASRATVADRTASDTAGGTDAAVRVALALSRTAADTAGATDFASGGKVILRTGTDTAGATDAAVRGFTVARTTADTAGATDAATRTSARGRTATDIAGGSDSASRQLSLSRTGTDTCGGTDSTSGGGPHSTTCSDSAGGTDSAGRLTARGRTAIDVAGATDSIVRILRAAKATSDTCGGTDSATGRLTIAHVHCSDTAGGTDSATGQHGIPQLPVYRLTSAGARWTVTAPSERWLVRSNG